MQPTLQRIVMAFTVFTSVMFTSTLPADAAPARKPTVTILSSASSAYIGTNVTFTISVVHGAPRQRVSLQVSRGRSWTTVASGVLPAKGALKQVVFSVRASAARVYLFRAALARKGKARASTSRTMILTALNKPTTGGSTTGPSSGDDGTGGTSTAPGSDPSGPMAVGAAFALGTWSISLGSTDTDGWPEIQAENMFNDAPPAGWSYVIVPATLTRLSGDPRSPWLDVDVEFLGSDHRIYKDMTDSDHYCGVVPNQISDVDDMYPGATVTANYCAAVPTSAIAGGVWRVNSSSQYPYVYRYVSTS